MRWEYAVLICTVSTVWPATAIFWGPTGPRFPKSDRYLDVLNLFGREGWESYAVGMREYPTDRAVEYSFWLKRPVPNA